VETHIIEASNGVNHGKFMLGRFDRQEWCTPSALPGHEGGSLLRQRGWGLEHIWVMIFKPGGLAKADLGKHGIWVCPLFEPFLEWLYQQPGPLLSALPAYVDLPGAPSALSGYRRAGPGE
jgi:hypothetical protein